MGTAWSTYMRMNTVLGETKYHQKTCSECKNIPFWSDDAYVYKSPIFDKNNTRTRIRTRIDT